MRSFTEPSTESGATLIGKAYRLSDESLVEAAKLGHSTAFDTLSERYRAQLFRAAHRITRSYEDERAALYIARKVYRRRLNARAWRLPRGSRRSIGELCRLTRRHSLLMVP